VKRDRADYDAYEGSNLPPLGKVGEQLVIHETRVRPLPLAGRRFNVRKTLDTNVTTALVYFGIKQS
jgi:hypothetical protein